MIYLHILKYIFKYYLATKLTKFGIKNSTDACSEKSNNNIALRLRFSRIRRQGITSTDGNKEIDPTQNNLCKDDLKFQQQASDVFW